MQTTSLPFLVLFHTPVARELLFFCYCYLFWDLLVLHFDVTVLNIYDSRSHSTTMQFTTSAGEIFTNIINSTLLTLASRGELSGGGVLQRTSSNQNPGIHVFYYRFVSRIANLLNL